jgi:hypothetical protein
LLKGLLDSEGDGRRSLLSVDLYTDPYQQRVRETVQPAADLVQYEFVQCNDLSIDIPLATDLLFIDTWHVYAQLKRELAMHHRNVRRWIVLHDTSIDAVLGESIRCGMDTAQQALATGFAESDICRGLWPAVEEFLADHNEWMLEERHTDQCGLTILRRAKDFSITTIAPPSTQ